MTGSTGDDITMPAGTAGPIRIYSGDPTDFTVSSELIELGRSRLDILLPIVTVTNTVLLVLLLLR